MLRLKERLFPSTERLNLFAPLAGALLAWLFQLLAIAVALAVQYAWARELPPPVPPDGRAQSTLFTGVALAPLLETAVLMWLISLLRQFTSRRSIVVASAGCVAALAHWQVGYTAPQVLLVGLGFAYMAAYAIHRSKWVEGKTVFLEVWALHAAHNLLALLPKEFMAA